MSVSEKGSENLVEDKAQAVLDLESRTDPAFARNTMRKIDLKLVPILAALYAIALIDRVNISNAYVAGMAKDLHLTVGSRYSIAVLIFFVPYIIFELPCNILVRRIGAARWIGTIVTLWGIIMLAMGWLKNWWQLVICRAFLGLLEAGFFPACTYIISTWYVRAEVQKRLTAFYVFSVMVAGFSSAIAGGISELAGKRGKNGWQWIFIILGSISIVGGLAAYFTVQDFPDKNTFLTKEETEFALARIDADRSDAEYDNWTWKKFRSYLCDWHLWTFALLFGADNVTTYAFGYFLSIILVEMGYSTRDAQLLVAPPYVFAAIFSVVLAIYSDRLRLRAPFMWFQSVIAIIGLSLMAFHKNGGVRYFGVFFGVAGGSANIPAVLCYLQNNTAGYTKRGFATALAIGFGGIGGIIASTVFRSQDAPGYRPGLWTAIGSQIVIIVVSGINTVYYYYRNKAVREGRAKPIEDRPGFFYTY